MWERRNFGRPEGLWYMRHAAALARWPVIQEDWARQMEDEREAKETAGRENNAFHHR
jgi:hypothetical protein